MPLNHYVTLGRSGLRVSPLCLGAMTFGDDWGWGSSVDDSCAIMDAYIDLGGNFIDTANIYTKGHSEKIMGDHLGRHAAKRDRLVIATKFLGNLYPGDPNGGGAHRKAIYAACEQSLRRLQTDHIDLYWMHFYDDLTPIDETMRAIDDLVRAGKVRYFGISDCPAWKCVQAQYEAIFRAWTPSIALQIEYSLVERTVEHELIPMGIANGMGVTPWSPLKGGLLSGKYRRGRPLPDEGRGTSDGIKNRLTEPMYDLIDVLCAVAEEASCTPAQAALAWVQGRPGVSSSIIGARTMAQLRDNVGALGVTLSAEHLTRLAEASTPPPIFPHNFLPFVHDNVQGGTTVNGRPSQPWRLAPQNDQERW
ncbi:MAG: aldo/keto reductase [Phycisphaeraceae bacterium]|nr:aldo/keto reductase [Phycisphaeraceae bacterium]